MGTLIIIKKSCGTCVAKGQKMKIKIKRACEMGEENWISEESGVIRGGEEKGLELGLYI